MRRPLIAGNWKMNGSLAEARALLGGILQGAGALLPRADLLVIPPFTALAEVGRLLRESSGAVSLGAQDLYWEPKGAFTGEISGGMLIDAGCTHVLVGHSERRSLFGEKGEVLLRKLAAALRDGLTPILCVGERLEERDRGETEAVLDGQLDETLFRLSEKDASKLILAYEPVWAIGTGRNATAEQAEGAHQHIRRSIATRWTETTADAIRILYGGSVTPANAAPLLACPNVDGALVGGASLRATDFLSIAASAGSSPGA